MLLKGLWASEGKTKNIHRYRGMRLQHCCCCCCCCLTLTLVKNLESVVTQRRWSRRNIQKTKWNQNSSGKYYASPPKTHEENAQVKRSNVQTELTWSPGSTQLYHRVPPSPQLTNSRLQTTAVGLPAPYEPHGNREHKRTRLLSGVLSEWRPAGMQWNKSNRTKKHNTNINDRPAFPSYMTGCSAATTPVPENWKLRGVVPHERSYVTKALERVCLMSGCVRVYGLSDQKFTIRDVLELELFQNTAVVSVTHHDKYRGKVLIQATKIPDRFFYFFGLKENEVAIKEPFFEKSVLFRGSRNNCIRNKGRPLDYGFWFFGKWIYFELVGLVFPFAFSYGNLARVHHYL